MKNACSCGLVLGLISLFGMALPPNQTRAADQAATAPASAPATTSAPARPASAPAPSAAAADAALSPPELAEVADQIVAGNSRKALDLLAAAGANRKKDAIYFVLMGRAYGAAGDDTLAIGSLRSAMEFKPVGPEALLQYGAALGRTVRFQEALTPLADGARQAPNDPRCPYAIAMVHARIGQADDCRLAMKQAADMSGPVAELAKLRLPQVEGFAEAFKKYQEAVTKLQDQLTQNGTDLTKVKEAGRAALDGKEKLRQDYESQRQAATNDYTTRVVDANRLYDQESPPPGLQRTNPAEYDRRKSIADQNRFTRQSYAANDRNQRYADIDRQFKPSVDSINAQISKLEQDVIKLNKDQEDLKRKLAEAPKKNQQPAPSFDPVADLRAIAKGTLGQNGGN